MRRSTGPSSARRELQPVESSISQASDHHASPDAAAPLAPDETASSEEPTTNNLFELLLPAGIFNNIFTCADVTEAISNYLLENHSELAGSLESALDELREQDVGVDVEAQNNILLHGDIIEAMSIRVLCDVALSVARARARARAR